MADARDRHDAAGDVRIEEVPDPDIIERTDAVIRVTRASICGSDLWPYNEMEPSESGRIMGHETIGVVEEVGADVENVKNGDVVLMRFAYSDGTCDFCRNGLQTACVHGGFFGKRRSSRRAGAGNSDSVGRRHALPTADRG